MHTKAARPEYDTYTVGVHACTPNHRFLLPKLLLSLLTLLSPFISLLPQLYLWIHNARVAVGKQVGKDVVYYQRYLTLAIMSGPLQFPSECKGIFQCSFVPLVERTWEFQKWWRHQWGNSKMKSGRHYFFDPNSSQVPFFNNSIALRRCGKQHHRWMHFP